MQYKKNQKKLFKFMLIIFLFIASIVAMVFGSINIGKNNTQKGLFGEQYFMSYALDLSNAGSTSLEKEEKLKSTANAFSAWLISKNINTTNIEYSINQDNSNIGYLYTERLNVSKIEYEGQKNVNQNPYFIALDTLSTSRIEIQQYNPAAKGKNDLPNKLETNYTNEQNWYSQVASPSDLNILSARKDYRDKLVTNDKTKNYGVQVDIPANKPLDVGAFDKDKTNSAEKKVEWILFQDLDILLAKLNYAKDLASRFSKNVLNDDERRYYNTLPSNLKEWATAAIKSTSGAQNTTPINRSNILYFYKNVPESSGDESTPSTVADSTDPNANSSLKSIVDPYIIGTIDYNSYNDWFPGTKVIGSSNSGDSNSGNNSGDNSNNNGNGSGGNSSGGSGGSTKELYATTKDTHPVTSISFQNTKSEQARTDFINRVKTMTFPVPLKQYDSGSINDYNNIRNSLFKAWINQSYIYDGFTGLKAYETSMLALGVVILLIAIIVSILYRIPGLFAGFSIVCASVFSASLLVILKVNFSISTIVGLFVSIVCALSSVVLFMERFRKSIKDNSSVFDSNINALKKSLFSILDVNMIMLFFGLGSIFVGKGEIVDFGLVLVLSSLITLASIFLFFVFPVFLCIDFYVLWNPKFHIFYNKNKIKEISPNSIFSFGEKYRKLIAPILIGISLLIFVIGLIMVFTLGIKNSSYYSNGTVVYLDYSTQNAPKVSDVLKWLPTNSWTFLWDNTSSKVMAFSSKYIFTYNQIMSQNFPSNYSISVAMSSATYAIDVSKSVVYAILIAYGFVAIYGIFRLNFFSIIPVFIASSLGSLVPIALCYLVWLPIDSLFIYASLFISIITTISSFLYISITKTRFNKRKISKFNELLSFVIINILNTKNIMIIIMSIILLSSVLFIGLGSLTMTMLFVYIIIGTILGMTISYLLIPFLYFVSLYIRQKYVKNIISNVENRFSKNIVNEIDEELIEGINKFN